MAGTYVTVLLGDDGKKLQRLVKELGRMCKKRKLTVNVKKSKMMKVSRKLGDQNELNISLDSRRMREVNAYKYLRKDVTNDGKMDEVNHRTSDAKKLSGGLQKL